MPDRQAGRGQHSNLLADEAEPRKTNTDRPAGRVGRGGGSADRQDVEGVSIVVPTYREAANIRALASRLDRALAGAGIRWELVVVDDDSGDGIEAIVEELAQTLPARINVRREDPRDLSLSVLLGFELSRFERIVVMDADLSHCPESVPEMVAALRSGCDMVVGSRYVRGASLDPDWTIWNLLNSLVATELARPLATCSDPLSGFFAIRRSILPSCRGMRPAGYKIGLELMARGGLRVRELPIRFAARRAGRSKTNWRQRYRFLLHLSRLYRARCGGTAAAYLLLIRWGGGLALDAALYVSFQLLGMEHQLARLAAFWPAAWLSGFLKRAARDECRTQPGGDVQRSARFPLSLVGFAADMGSYATLATLLGDSGGHRAAAFLFGVATGRAAMLLCKMLQRYQHVLGEPKSPDSRRNQRE